MKILKPVMTAVENGDLDFKQRFSNAPRLERGMKTRCAACGKDITDEFFIGGFKAGHQNLILHERCAP